MFPNLLPPKPPEPDAVLGYFGTVIEGATKGCLIKEKCDFGYFLLNIGKKFKEFDVMEIRYFLQEKVSFVYNYGSVEGIIPEKLFDLDWKKDSVTISDAQRSYMQGSHNMIVLINFDKDQVEVYTGNNPNPDVGKEDWYSVKNTAKIYVNLLIITPFNYANDIRSLAVQANYLKLRKQI